LHIIGFVLGSVAIAAGVAAVGVATGFSGWAAFGLAVASFVLAQFLYLLWVAAMAVFESRRNKLRGPEAGAPAKPPQRVVQKG
jgi:tellurite resistance protein TehA-like permease